MATFPLLNLSPSISEQILRSLTFGELFDLSQCSTRTFTLIKNSRSNVERPPRFLVRLVAGCSFKLFSFFQGHSQEASWEFLEDRDIKIMDLENPRTYKIAGCEPIDFCISRQSPTSVDYSCGSRHSVKDILNFCQYLITLFHCPVAFLEVSPFQKKFLDDILAIDAFRKCPELNLDYGILAHKDLRKILENFKAERMTLSCSTRSEFSYNQPIICNAFSAFSGTFVNLQFIQNLDCKTGTIFDSPMSNEDLNKYLKSWLAGSNTKLEYITFSILDPDGPGYKFSTIVEGIPCEPGVAKRSDATRFRSYRQPIDYATGMDLRRDSDGMLATVLHYQDRLIGNTILFVVWHVPNPNLVVVQ